MRDWNGKPYHSLDYALREAFGEKVYKAALNGGFTCPNRDGKLGNRGCIFCSAGGSGDFAAPAELSITEQLDTAIEGISRKTTANKFIAYFQAFTNTYGPIEKMGRLFTEAVNHPKTAILSVATRPDCLPEEVLDLLSELNQIKPVWVELGLQTIHEDTAKWMRRGYELSTFEEAVKKLRKRGITVIVHVILGLKNESKEMMLETVRYLARMDIQGIKLQLLHVIEGTDLAEEYKQGEINTFTQDEYVDLVIDCLETLSPEIVIHRLTGDGPSRELVAPLWSTRKREVLNQLHREMKLRQSYQGKCFGFQGKQSG
ncbi:MAG: TIGR01212 family radical SAM protein [Lachnospiraceae bacterium]|nr:TIGR01212 family radical SAM protein [Lachnospiraceae bacterium]